ncbi:MAG: hypothetical protein ABI230_05405 [Aestuariivirga sp.]
MGFFTGPSDQYLEKMALGICSNFFQLLMIDEFDELNAQRIKSEMAAQGLSLSFDGLVNDVAEIVHDHNMGAWKRGKFVLKIHTQLLRLGVDPDIATHFGTVINEKAKAYGK